MSLASMQLTEEQVVLHILTCQITAALRSAASEQYYPQRSGDEMDQHIKEGLERARELTELRYRYETIMTGVLSRV